MIVFFIIQTVKPHLGWKAGMGRVDENENALREREINKWCTARNTVGGITTGTIQKWNQFSCCIPTGEPELGRMCDFEIVIPVLRLDTYDIRIYIKIQFRFLLFFSHSFFVQPFRSLICLFLHKKNRTKINTLNTMPNNISFEAFNSRSAFEKGSNKTFHIGKTVAKAYKQFRMPWWYTQHTPVQRSKECLKFCLFFFATYVYVRVFVCRSRALSLHLHYGYMHGFMQYFASGKTP